jgi:ABC-type branched-subunit amino acid transport system substrate-binding protein
LAAETFKQLSTHSNPFTEYATFYYGLSSYYDGKSDIAKNILLQLTRKYSNWNNIYEAQYWLGKLYFEQGANSQAIEQLNLIKNRTLSKDISSLKVHYLSQVSLEELQELHQQYPNDPEVGESLARVMGQQPLSREDMNTLQVLVDKYDLSEEEITNQFVGKTEHKDQYKVAVCFPFMIDEIDEDRRQNSNQWVLELFQGIQLAQNELKSEGIDINLYAYDTKRDSVRMGEILALEEMKGMDLMVGPLYPGPSKLASEFAFSERINILNPLSSNPEIISHNPYSFLFHPSDVTQAKAAGSFMKGRLNQDKKALIIYGSRGGDSIAAFQYRAQLMEKGIEVIMMDQIPTVDSEQVAKFVSDNLYTIFTPDPDDPVLLAKKEQEEEDEQDEDVFIPRSDLGHVFVASTNQLVVANVIGTLDNIGAEITIMGNDRWLQSRYVDFQQLERLQVYMTAPGYLEYDTENFKTFQKKYMQKFANVPGYYSFVGYDLMLVFGKLMDQGGTYFQHEVAKNDFYPGYLFQGYNYQQSNDNANVPIVHFEDGILQKVDR